MPNNDAKLSLRLPSALRDELEGMANRDRRSLNAQILVILERAVEEHKAASKDQNAGD